MTVKQTYMISHAIMIMQTLKSYNKWQKRKAKLFVSFIIETFYSLTRINLMFMTLNPAHNVV